MENSLAYYRNYEDKAAFIRLLYKHLLHLYRQLFGVVIALVTIGVDSCVVNGDSEDEVNDCSSGSYGDGDTGGEDRS